MQLRLHALLYSCACAKMLYQEVFLKKYFSIVLTAGSGALVWIMLLCIVGWFSHTNGLASSCCCNAFCITV